MMKHACTIALLLAACGPCPSEAADATTLTAEGLAIAVDSTVRVERAEAGGLATGSGTAIGEDGENYYVVSNYHVTRDKPLSISTFYNHGRLPGATGELINWRLNEQKSADLALIKVPKSSVRDTVTVSYASPEAPAVGDSVILVGCPGGAFPQVRFCRITEIRGHIIHYVPPPRSGDSGGGLFDLEGRYVGTNVWSWNRNRVKVGGAIAAWFVKQQMIENRHLTEAADVKSSMQYGGLKCPGGT